MGEIIRIVRREGRQQLQAAFEGADITASSQVTTRQGSLQVQDGPFAEAKEMLAACSSSMSPTSTPGSTRWRRSTPNGWPGSSRHGLLGAHLLAAAAAGGGNGDGAAAACEKAESLTTDPAARAFLRNARGIDPRGDDTRRVSSRWATRRGGRCP
ncbi:MAG: hypothetical protein M3527_00760 [Actinomycetota bacterium]|nr:hypothetical protein [Actinomycetota bacterium]